MFVTTDVALEVVAVDAVVEDKTEASGTNRWRRGCSAGGTGSSNAEMSSFVSYAATTLSDSIFSYLYKKLNLNIKSGSRGFCKISLVESASSR